MSDFLKFQRSTPHSGRRNPSICSSRGLEKTPHRWPSEWIWCSWKRHFWAALLNKMNELLNEIVLTRQLFQKLVQVYKTPVTCSRLLCNITSIYSFQYKLGVVRFVLYLVIYKPFIIGFDGLLLYVQEWGCTDPRGVFSVFKQLDLDWYITC